MKNNDNFFGDEEQSNPEKEKSQLESTDNAQEESVESGNILYLPSGGMLGYPDHVKFRDIMAGDEEILASATGDTYSATLNGVLKSILNDCEFFERMTVADRDFCLIWIWSNNYQPVKKSTIRCPHCGHEFEKEYDMMNLPYKEISEKYDPKFYIDIKKTGGKMFVRLNTVGDEIEAEKLARSQKKRGTKDKDLITYDRAMLYMSIAIEGAENLSIEQKAKWIATNVSARELGYAKQFHKFFSYGINTVIDVECPSCEGEAKAKIPFQAEDVLYPEVRTDFEDLL